MRGSVRILLVSCLATVVAPGPSAAADPPSAPKTELERLHHAMGEISAHISNAGSKLKSGVVSMGGRSRESPATPAQDCCTNNLEAIEKHLTALREGIRKLRACYAGEGQDEAEVHVNLVFQDAESLHRALSVFRNADEQSIHYGYGAVMRSFFLLRKSAKELIECPGKP